MAAQNIIGILCGVNQLYYPGKIKGIAPTIDKMNYKPADLLRRLEQLFQLKPMSAVAELSALIDETLSLVEMYLPEVDTRRTREVQAMVLRK